MADRWNAEGCPTNLLDMVPAPGQYQMGVKKPDPTADQRAQSFVQRVLQIGGPLAQYGQSPQLQTYDELFRVEPNDSWFSPDRGPSNPTQFEIGSVSPEQGRWIFVFDYHVIPYGFSGLAANDVDPFTDGEISGSFGHNVKLGGRSPGVLNMRLSPVSPNLDRTQFQFNQRGVKPVGELTTSDFARTQAATITSASGFGADVQPQTPFRFGARNVPWMLSVGDDLVLTLTGIIFGRVPFPIAFIEGRVKGYICSAVIAKKLLQDLNGAVR